MLLNGAGLSAADPILKGLGVEWRFASSTMDIASLVEAWIDTNSVIFPGTTSVKVGLSPAATVLTSGNAGTYDDVTKEYTISSTTGLTVGDPIYLSHASLVAGIYLIAGIPLATKVLITGNPLNGLGAKTAISYQVGWQYDGVAGTAPLVSSGAGTKIDFKVRAQDSLGNQTDFTDFAYFADAPAGTSYISIGGQAYDANGTVNDTSPTLTILSGWTNNGGVSHVELAAHSVQAVNNFTWADTTTGEKTIAYAETSNNFLASAGDGQKYGQLRFKSKSGGVTVNVDIAVKIDTTGPTITMALAGR